MGKSKISIEVPLYRGPMMIESWSELLTALSHLEVPYVKVHVPTPMYMYSLYSLHVAISCTLKQQRRPPFQNLSFKLHCSGAPLALSDLECPECSMCKLVI